MIKKKIGVWMDHSHAQLLEYGQHAEDIRIIQPDQLHSHHPEFKEHNIEQQKLNTFFDILEQELVSYDVILLLGGKTAKEEFFNRIRHKETFIKKKISKMTTDHFTPKQFVTFINAMLDDRLAR
jgi:stalled ribosome rescue protein Dom34